MSASDFLEDELLDQITKKGDYSPVAVYLALSTADPTDDASGLAEPSGGSYARLITAPANWDAASGGSVANAVDLSFIEATGDWGTITHFALYDAITEGNMLASGALSASKAVASGNTARFLAGTITITLG